MSEIPRGTRKAPNRASSEEIHYALQTALNLIDEQEEFLPNPMTVHHDPNDPEWGSTDMQACTRLGVPCAPDDVHAARFTFDGALHAACNQLAVKVLDDEFEAAAAVWTDAGRVFPYERPKHDDMMTEYLRMSVFYPGVCSALFGHGASGRQNARRFFRSPDAQDHDKVVSLLSDAVGKESSARRVSS